MANWQVISLDTTTPQLRAPGTGDGYSFNSGSTQLGVWTTTGLGIGTASPAAKLDVVGTAQISSALTLSGGTANGVLYLNGSQVATSGSALTFDGTSLRIGGSGSGARLVVRGTGTTSATFSIEAATSGGATRFIVADDGLCRWYGTSNSETMRLDNAGNLGIGTTSPGVKLDVQGVVPFIRLKESTTGYLGFRGQNDSGNFYFGIDNSSGSFYGSAYARVLYADGAYPMAFYTNATERARIDSSGNLLVGATANPGILNKSVVVDSGASSLAGFVMQNDTTGRTSTDGGAMLMAGADMRLINLENSFMVFGTNNTERARITAGGDFELGTQAGTGTRTLTVTTNTSGDPTVILSAAGVDSGGFRYGRADSRLYAISSNTGGVYLAAGGTSWTAVSDERKKDIIEPIANAAEKVASLRAVVGKYKTDKNGVRRSFLIAQDVRAVFPEAVDASDESELGLSYTDTIPLLVAAIKEQQAMINELKVKVAALEAK